MDRTWKTTTWQQFGAAIDMLENAITACPPALWSDRSREPEYWYLVFHTLFWLDYYVAQPVEGFRPPPPFGLEEMDPAGVLPPRVYTQRELLTYLEHGRRSCHAAIANLTADRACQHYRFGTADVRIDELFLYNMRHVQHGAAQLNLLLRQSGVDAPRWVKQAKQALA